jgi:hypothetical protein
MMSWASMKQNSVALNTTKLEYISTSNACIEAMWLRKLVS